ncbi:MAG: hypothetical protein WA461_06550 [Nitrososphaeraceae archaeon]
MTTHIGTNLFSISAGNVGLLMGIKSISYHHLQVADKLTIKREKRGGISRRI